MHTLTLLDIELGLRSFIKTNRHSSVFQSTSAIVTILASRLRSPEHPSLQRKHMVIQE